MIDAYLARLAQALRVPRRRRERILAEVRDHLDDAKASLVDQGFDADVAERHAIESFGDGDLLAGQFNLHSAASTMRRMPLLMAVCGFAVIAGFLGAAIPQPTGPPLPPRTGPMSSPPAAPLPRQIIFFAGVIGIQVAFVAGARAAARVAARWGTLPAAADIRLVGRAATVFLVGLMAAALSWGVALIDVAGTRTDARVVPLIAGLAAMISAVAVAAAFGLRRHDAVDPANDGDRLATGRTMAAAGERLFAWARGHALLSCSLVAVVTGVAAMAHAETTVVAALPWGLAQAAAVVTAYFALGPALELRT